MEKRTRTADEDNAGGRNTLTRFADPDLTGAGERGLGMPSDEDMQLLREDMADAHGEGLHADLPREFCPLCDA